MTPFHTQEANDISFNRLTATPSGFKDRFSRHKYTGTLDDVLTKIEEISARGVSSEDDTLDLILHPPRVIRAVVDYKIQNPSLPEAEELIRDAISLALKLYSSSTPAVSEIHDFRARVVESGNESLLTRVLKQPGDLGNLGSIQH